MQNAPAHDSFPPASQSGCGVCETGCATRRCARRPSGVRDVVDAAERIHRGGGYGECSVASGPPSRSPGSRTLCRGTDAGDPRASDAGAGRRGYPTWLSPLSCRACWRRLPPRPAGRRLGRSVCDASYRACHGPSDWGLFAPPNGALTMALSSDCQRHWIPRRSSYRVNSLPQSRWKMPAWTHSWMRRWQVDPDPYSRGRAFHWQPVRSTYRMPSMTWRKGTTGRPLVPGGFSGGKSGWNWAQRSSRIRQIVPNRRFDRCRVAICVDLCCDESR